MIIYMQALIVIHIYIYLFGWLMREKCVFRRSLYVFFALRPENSG